jgi:hypothetical protein
MISRSALLCSSLPKLHQNGRLQVSGNCNLQCHLLLGPSHAGGHRYCGLTWSATSLCKSHDASRRTDCAAKRCAVVALLPIVAFVDDASMTCAPAR